MNLQTGKLITCKSVTELPITNLMIKAIEQMADEQGITTLQITGWNKIPIYLANWIA